MGNAWSQCDSDLLTYDSAGMLSFTVDDFSGYAVADIPEPGTLALLAMGALCVLRRRRWE